MTKKVQQYIRIDKNRIRYKTKSYIRSRATSEAVRGQLINKRYVRFTRLNLGKPIYRSSTRDASATSSLSSVPRSVQFDRGQASRASSRSTIVGSPFNYLIMRWVKLYDIRGANTWHSPAACRVYTWILLASIDGRIRASIRYVAVACQISVSQARTAIDRLVADQLIQRDGNYLVVCPHEDETLTNNLSVKNDKNKTRGTKSRRRSVPATAVDPKDYEGSF